MRNLTLTLFSLSCFLSSCLAFSQSNFLSVHAGIEFAGTIKDDVPIPFPSSAVIRVFITEPMLVRELDLAYNHQSKIGFIYETGMELRGFQKNLYYAIDSTPFYGSGFSVSSSPRPYDRKIKLLQIAPFFKFGYSFKISRQFNLIPQCGVFVCFNMVEKQYEHYYKADSTGISDPGPYYSIVNYAQNQNPFSPDQIALIVGSSLKYHWRKKWSFSILPEVRIQTNKIDFFFRRRLWEVKAGVVYLLTGTYRK